VGKKNKVLWLGLQVAIRVPIKVKKGQNLLRKKMFEQTDLCWARNK
jgi:hypothetical protein